MIKIRLYRPIYVIVRLATMIISAVSRFLNALFYNGSTYQTLSARSYIDGKTSAKWAKRRNFIDLIFWFEPAHCEQAWLNEIAEARKTLSRAE
jgi:hypothetical protein